MTKRPDPDQMDLFAWADSRPTAIILDAIPRIAKRMWRERNDPIAQREGRLVTLPTAAPEVRRTA